MGKNMSLITVSLLVWVSTQCEYKMKKQDLKGADSWWQNSNSISRSRSKNQSQNKTEIWNEKDGFKPGIRLKIRLKNDRNVLS